MKKIVLLALSCLTLNYLMAQDAPVKKKEPINLSGRAADHLMIQTGFTSWANKPDTINTGGFSNSFNLYFMFDFPFKSNPKLSIGIGPGISSDHIKFKKTYIGIKENASAITFRGYYNSDSANFKKAKLATVYLEAPIEFRYTAKPLKSNQSFKFAVGLKVGTMINAHTRYKTLENKAGNPINDYSMKENSKKFFNTTRLVASGRVGIGPVSLYGSYQLTTLFKEGMGPDVRPFTIGLTFSGL